MGTTTYSNLNQTTDVLRGWVREAIECDDRRHSVSHEHTATLAGGIGLILCAFIVPGRVTAVLQAAAGGALLLRAASGRDGIRKWSGAEGARPMTEVDAAVRASNEMGM
ncbi:MAG TPA: hypothetical protein VEP93_10505 [Variovorax sp.]|nr:hypothetical protein [Variovorax sp.]